METVGGGGDGGANSLEEFVTSEIRRQTDQGGNNDAGDTEPAGGGQAEEGSQLSAEQESNFVQRALTESRRMNNEVKKSQAKRDKVRAEMGTSNIANWQTEHAAAAFASNDPGAEAEATVAEPAAGRT